ncbi:putative outer membrane starch-binding protein [Breznakibacter xylanolyticus]|uniref:Putative outer membrane starch-binding protein n=1 Tax=Breznakibacter xylanolyticus TaxID=990 RepID=A0A2W7NF89_9BACT|nr:RagB/SusD family nutrient uptake outer membrane protein [Breznakibacter xylanolyticus]PZX16817.1 putative outer membrane starch-binding protein [Breznakibacter xylanolyticus]
MKKSFIYIASLTVSLMSFGACSDEFLDTSSKTELNTETFYKTVADAEMALIGCYDGWQRTISSGGPGFYLASEMLSDQCFGGAGNGDGRNWQVLDRFDQTESTSDVDIYDTDWQNYYAAIYRCNELLDKTGQMTWPDEAAKGRILGECRAMRAILYFDLARLFGDVPLFTEPVNENRPRAAADSVYKVIVADLNYASANIPANAYPVKGNNATDGRITKFAAQAMLARVYLFYSGYYGKDPEGCTKEQALAAVESVIKEGGYSLEKKYADLWMPACTQSSPSEYSWVTTYAGKYYNADGWHAGQGELSKEFILNMKFNTTQDYNGNADGNAFQVFLGMRNTNHPPFAVGWGCCSVNPKFVKKFLGDPRVEASVIDYKGIGFEAAESFSKCFNDTREYTGYAIKKYSPLCFFDGTRESVGFKLGEQHQNITYYIDYTIMRYADVLLMAAELGSENAQTHFNEVRGRAGYTDVVPVSKEAIMQEREVEFAFEGIRYWDLLRQGVDVAAATITANQNGTIVKSGGADDVVVTSAANISAKKGLQQIPNKQITLSDKVLTQNTGW